jgi:autotransporter-associated beta strand protein
MKTWTLASAKCWIHRTRRGLRLAIALFAWLGLAPLFVTTERAPAATFTWDSDAIDTDGAQDGSGTWSTTNFNWFLNNATADIGWTNNTTDIALFGVSGGTGGAITVSGNFSVGGIQFTAADPGSFSFSGTQTLTLGSSGILVNSGAGSENFASGIAFSLASGQTWTNSSSSLLTIGGNVSLANAGTQTLALAGSGDRTLSGNLSNGAGTLALAQSGSGTLTLSGTNSFTGGLSASGGTLKATTIASALGAGSLSLGGAALVLANDTGLNFGNATTLTTSATITSDRLTLGAGVTQTLGTLTMGASTLTINAGANVASGTAGITFGNVSLSSGPTFAVNSGASLQLGALQFNSHKVSFTKSGAGTLVLANSATGMVVNDNPPTYQLLISGGTVQANANDVGDQISVDKAPILDINPASGTAALNSQTFSQGFEHLVLGGGYNFVTSTGAAGTAGTTSNITGTGTITVRLGQIVYNGGLSTATGPTGSTISTNLVNGDGATALAFNIGHVTGNAADATFSGSINAGTANGWTKTGAGIMVLSGNSSTDTGTINLGQGVLSLQNANALGSTSVLAINPGASTSAFLDLGTGNTSFVRPWGTAAGQINIGNNTASAIDGFQTSSPTGASLNINNGTSAPVWTQSGFQPGTLQLGTTSSLGPLTFVGGITLVSGSTPRPIQVDRGNFTLGAGNANLTSANNYFDAQITQVGSTLNAGTIAKGGNGVLSIAGASTDATTNSSYVVNNGVLLFSRCK